MQGLEQVTQQVENLRRELHTLMQSKQFADAEIMTMSATMDAQLEDYQRMLQEKRMPSMRTF